MSKQITKKTMSQGTRFMLVLCLVFGMIASPGGQVSAEDSDVDILVLTSFEAEKDELVESQILLSKNSGIDTLDLTVKYKEDYLIYKETVSDTLETSDASGDSLEIEETGDGIRIKIMFADVYSDSNQILASVRFVAAADYNFNDEKPISVIVNSVTKEGADVVVASPVSVEEKKLPLPDGLLKFYPVERSEVENSSNGYAEITETNMEIGNKVLIGIQFDPGKLTEDVDSIRSLHAVFDYSQDYYDIVFSSDIMIVDPATAVSEDSSEEVSGDASGDASGNASGDISGDASGNASGNASAEAVNNSRFQIVWNREKQSLDFNVNQPSASGNPEGLSIIICLTVKKEVEKDDSYFLKDISIRGNRESGFIEKYYKDEISCSLSNSMHGNRLLELGVTTDKDQGQLKAAKGMNVMVPVYIKNNTGFNQLEVTAKFDSLLTFEGVLLSPDSRKYADISNIVNETNSVIVTIKGQTDIKIKDDTRLLTFIFAAVTESEGSVAISASGLLNQSETNMRLLADDLGRNVKVIEEWQYGDINEDGRVSLLDAAYLLQYYNGVRVLTKEQIKRGDVDDSGAISLVDVLLIMKYYNSDYTDTNGWKVQLISS